MWVAIYVHGYTDAREHWWRSEQFAGAGSILQTCGFCDKTQVVQLGGQDLYLLRPLA